MALGDAVGFGRNTVLKQFARRDHESSHPRGFGQNGNRACPASRVSIQVLAPNKEEIQEGILIFCDGNHEEIYNHFTMITKEKWL